MEIATFIDIWWVTGLVMSGYVLSHLISIITLLHRYYRYLHFPMKKKAERSPKSLPIIT